ncbi:hypothetical protein SNE510_69130 [Streptomyces sp. NE5-10]|nr:hypothetical protein SNE510_69130 [Streptomyces sp. NE5-10]
MCARVPPDAEEGAVPPPDRRRDGGGTAPSGDDRCYLTIVMRPVAGALIGSAADELAVR